MQEGTMSLMQMAKVCDEVYVHRIRVWSAALAFALGAAPIGRDIRSTIHAFR